MEVYATLIMGYFQARIAARVNEDVDNLNVVYAAYDVDEWEVPINNIDQMCAEGKFTFVLEKNVYVSEAYINPTWLDICAEMHKYSKKFGIKNVIFIESIEISGQEIFVNTFY